MTGVTEGIFMCINLPKQGLVSDEHGLARPNSPERTEVVEYAELKTEQEWRLR